jgi:hypothetical protein
MRDTAPAVSHKEDVRGRPLPDGLLVLVIDAIVADKASDRTRWAKLVPSGSYQSRSSNPCRVEFVKF